MGKINEHLEQYLTAFVQIPDEGFDLVFDNLQNAEKEVFKSLLIYLDKLINQLLNKDRNVLSYSHLEIEGIKDEYSAILCEFIMVKFFYMGLSQDCSSDQNEDYLQPKINALRLKAKQYETYPERLSLIKPSRKTKIWLQQKGAIKHQMSFYSNLIETR
jgi:hypothetical protein